MSISINREQELLSNCEEAGADSKTISNLLIHRRQASLIASYFSESDLDFEQDYGQTSNQLLALGNLYLVSMTLS